MSEGKDRKTMQGSPLPEADEWAMPERRERDVMRDMPPRKRDSGDDDFRLPTARGSQPRPDGCGGSGAP